MTREEMEHAIEFLLGHHAKVSVEIQQHSEQIAQLTKAVSALTVNMQDGFDRMREEVQDGFERMREEVRDGFDKLILGNEVTRQLAQDVARLGLQTSQRVTAIDGRVSELESKLQ